MDTIIIPADPTSSVNIDTTYPPDPVDTQIKTLTKILDHLDRTMEYLHTMNPTPIVSHNLVLEGSRTMDLNLMSADIHIIHTGENSYSFVHVYADVLNDQGSKRRSFSIVNKGMGLIVLLIHNTFAGTKVTRRELLEPFQRCELSSIDDGAGIIVC